MKRRLNFLAERRIKTPSLLTAVFLASATAFFFLSLAVTTAAVEGALGGADTLTGEITAIDASRPTKSLTLQSSELGLAAPNNMMNIFVNDKTVVQMCYAAKKSLKDLKPGSKTQVTYHEIAGLAVADFIYKPC
ncbi:MAG TPA: hypothetical protein VLG39_06005 [Nitrospirota bacterium]|nr:hypothetical protein [Nitrospirota bacterium]